MENKNILFAVSSLGLGHATRSLPIIKSFLLKNKVIMVSYGKVLKFLKEELKGYKNIRFIELEDYSAILSGSKLSFYFNIIPDSLHTLSVIRKEQKFVKNLLADEEIDFIFSDSRYGIYSKEVPSFLLTHFIRFPVPPQLKWTQGIMDSFSKGTFKNFDFIFIPDFKGKANLSGEISHNSIIENIPHKFIGALSSYEKLRVKQDIDYYFIVSGYLLDNKEGFVSNLISQAKNLKGKKVFALGDNTKEYHTFDKENNIEIYSSVSGKLRNELMNRAKVVVSRSGYTTIMDLAELGKKAIVAPTPKQEEQVWLARDLGKRGLCVSFDSEKSFDLKSLAMKIKKCKPFRIPFNTKESVRLVNQTIDSKIN